MKLAKIVKLVISLCFRSIKHKPKGMQTTTQIKLYQVFRARFGDADAEQIVSIIEDTIDNKVEAKKDVLLTQADKVELLKEISRVKVDIIKWVFSFFLALALMILGLYLKG